MLKAEDLTNLIEDQISNNFYVFLAIDEDGDLLVNCLLLLLLRVIVEVMPFGLLGGNESAVLWRLPIRQFIHWVVNELLFLYLLHVS